MTVFDLDGVLSRADTMAAVVLARLRSKPWLAPIVAYLVMVAALSAADGERRPRCNRAIVHLALSGMSEAAYKQLAERVARHLASRAGNTSTEILTSLREAAGRDDGCVITTASEGYLATRYLAEIGVPDAPVHASTFAFGARGPRFVTHNVGQRKVDALRAAFPELVVRVLYTDSASDLPLARCSKRTVLVGPSRRTRRAFARSDVRHSVLARR